MNRALLAIACMLVASTASAQAKNRAPKANPGGPYTAIIGQALVVDGSASTDDDGSIAKYHWTASNGYEVWALDTPKGALIFPIVGSYSLKLVVVDNKGAASTGVSTTVTVGAPPPPPPPPPEVCGDGIDNDGDGLVDEGCTPPPPPPAEICGDGIDNDGDGLVDEGCTPPPSEASPDGTVVPPAASITDAAGNVWTLGAIPDSAPTLHIVVCNGHPAESGYASAIRYLGGVVAVLASDSVWYQVACGSGSASGGGGGSPPPPSAPNIRVLSFAPHDQAEYAAVIQRVLLQIDSPTGVLVQVVELGKPSATEDTGVVTVPVALALTVGQTYQARVAVCSEVVCAYSAGASFVF